MSERLLIAVLGNRNSGKSTTWNDLFGANVRTTRKERKLFLNCAQFVEVFLVSGSPEERQVNVGSILGNSLPRIVLCSTQYRQDVKETFDYFFDSGYEVFVQWLNPGYRDPSKYEDLLELQNFLLEGGATLQIRNGVMDSASRIREIRQFILGWAIHRDLVRTKFPAG